MRSIAWKVIVVAGLLTGCLSVDPPEGHLVCTEANVAVDCPSGWSCVDGFCYREPGSRDGGPDASRTDAGTDAGQDARVTCEGASECDDDNPCTVDSCNAEGICENVFTPNDTPDLPDDTGSDENCDGADGVVTRDVYVVPGGTGAGTPSDPASLASALEAVSGDGHVIVAAGDHEIDAPLAAPDGLQMHGGYGLDFRSRPGGTRVISSATRALEMRGLTAATIDQVDWQTADATTPGEHTQTITVVGSTGITLRRLTVSAGHGAPGNDGTPGLAGAPPGPAGANGSNGSGTMGGAGASCGTPGGQGAGVGAPQIGGSDAAVVGTGCGHGGAQGATVRDSRTCSSGGTYVASSTGNGRAGEPGCPQAGVGIAGAGGSGPGTVDTNDGTWSGAGGAIGGTGPAGNAGGGAGGGGSYYRSECSASAAGGGGGGCGGLGGNGGQGGGPGQAGGASIAIVMADSTVVLERVTLRTGNGGNGGRGADGGAGASGVPGSGGGAGGIVSGSLSTTHQGGSGGRGGDGSAGGPGGCGGGGAGGSSIGVFHAGSGSVDPQSVTYELGEGGAAGEACPAAATDPARGEAGAAGTTIEVVRP